MSSCSSSQGQLRECEKEWLEGQEQGIEFYAHPCDVEDDQQESEQQAPDSEDG